MTYFNFTRLITKYISPFTATIASDGAYNDVGEWVAGATSTQELTGAIISFRESKIYRAEGTLTANDKHLFMLSPIANNLKGSKIIYNGKVYSIEEETENAKFTGVYSYVLRYVSAFGGVA